MNAARATIALGILGDLTATVDGVEVTIGAGYHRTVLNVLAALPRHVDSGELVEILSAVHDGGRRPTKHNVHSAVTRLRRLLPGGIESAGSAYRLAAGVEVDARTFTSVVQSGGRLLGSDDASAAERLTAALDLWRGQALADWCRAEPAKVIVAQLDELRAGAVEDLAAALGAIGRDEEALERLASLLACEPYREHAWALALAAHGRLGQTALATQAYDRARRALAEIGLTPGAELSQAWEQVRVTDRVVVDPLLRADPPPALIDRDHALRLIDGWIDGPRAPIVSIVGQAGIGKRRLAFEIARRSIEAGWAAWFGADHGPRATQRMVHRVVEAHPGAAPAPPHPSGASDEQTLHAFGAALPGLLEGAAAGRCLLVLDGDELQATSASVQALIATHPALVVISIHAVSAPWAPARHTIELGPLAPAECGLLASSISGQRVPVTPEDAQRLHLMTGGNPGMVAALAADADPTGALLADGSPPGRRVTAAVEEVLQGLSSMRQAVLDAAAVLGDVFDRAVVRHMVGQMEADDAFDAAVQAGVLRTMDVADEHYTFVAEALRRVVVHRLEPTRRARLHLAAGRAIERVHPEADPTVSAGHFVRAVPAVSLAEATHRARRAGEWAMRRGRHADADRWFGDALRLLASDGRRAAEPDEVELRLLIARARSAAGQVADAGSAAKVAARLAEANAWVEAYVRSLAVVAEAQTRMHLGASGRRILHQAADGSVQVAPGIRGLALALLALVEPLTAAGLTARVREEVRALRPQDRAEFLEYLCWYRLGADLADVGEEMIALGHEANDPAIIGLGLLRVWMAGISRGTSRFDDADLGGRLDRAVASSSSPLLEWNCAVWNGARCLATGDLDGAAHWIDAAEQMPVHAGGVNVPPAGPPTPRQLVAFGQRLGLAMAHGDIAAVTRMLEHLSRQPGHADQTATPFHVLTAAIAGDHERAATLADDVVSSGLLEAPRSSLTLVHLALLAGGVARIGGTTRCETLLAAMHHHRDHHALLGKSLYLGSLRHHEGLLYAAIGDVDAAIEALEDAIGQHTAVGSSLYETFSRHRLDELRSTTRS